MPLLRTCDDCGHKMPLFAPRKRAADGRLLCPGCHPLGKGSPDRPIGLHGSRKTADSDGFDEPFSLIYTCNGRTWAESLTTGDLFAFDETILEDHERMLQQVYDDLGPAARYVVRGREGECKYKVDVTITWRGAKGRETWTIDGGWKPETAAAKSYGSGLDGYDFGNWAEEELGELFGQGGIHLSKKAYFERVDSTPGTCTACGSTDLEWGPEKTDFHEWACRECGQRGSQRSDGYMNPAYMAKKVAFGETCPKCGGPIADDFHLPGEGGGSPWGYTHCPRCGIVPAPKTTGVKVATRMQKRARLAGQMSGTGDAWCLGCGAEITQRDGIWVWVEDGSTDCPGSDNGLHAPGVTSMRRVAHDSGDGATIYHCPFCGSGQVTARSDGTVGCGYCKSYFTVQVQPEHSSMPQTIDGKPVQMPGMPGSIEQAPPGQEPAQDPAGDAGAFTPPEAPADVFTPPEGGQEPPQQQVAKRAGIMDYYDVVVHWRGDEVGVVEVGSADVEAMIEAAEDFQTDPKAFRVWVINRGNGEFVWANGERKIAKAYFLTAEGYALDEEAYVRHLAIHHADDPAGVIDQVRAERGLR